MIAVIFEARPAPSQKQRYLDLAAALRSDLETIDRFLSIDRALSEQKHHLANGEQAG